MFLVMAVALLAAALHRGAAIPADILGMVVNDAPKGDVIAVLDGPNTWVPVAALDDGLRRFGGDRRMLFNAPHVLLDSLAPDVTYRRDLTDIVLRVIAAPQFFDTNTVVLQRERPEGISYASTTTFFTNYSVTWDQQAGMSGYGASGISLFGNTSIGSAYAVDAGGAFSRGLSTLTVDRLNSRLRLRSAIRSPRPRCSARRPSWPVCRSDATTPDPVLLPLSHALSSGAQPPRPPTW
jgi:hypothetical protein